MLGEFRRMVNEHEDSRRKLASRARFYFNLD